MTEISQNLMEESAFRGKKMHLKWYLALHSDFTQSSFLNRFWLVSGLDIMICNEFEFDVDEVIFISFF